METMIKDKKIGLISLGCDKNRVDSEKILGLIDGKAIITNDIEEANIIIVNSCAFLESARKEAIDTVLECNELRSKNLEKIVLTGCLPERYVGDLFDDFTEVDLFMGILDYDLLFEGLERAYKGERVNFVHKNKIFETKKRILTTPCHYYYLKIADGCNNKCTYCLIPSIRGKYRSTPINDLIEEVKGLGYTEEVILVAQDVTRYGIDFDGKPHIVELIKELTSLQEVGSVRLLYCYPDMVTDELIEEIKNNDKVIKYLDIPLQHASNPVLKRMNRKGTGEDYLRLINRLKSQIKGLALRSTFIVGFPGETDKDYEVLKEFIKNAKFTNCGFFAYSREKDTPSNKLDGHILKKIKDKRVKELYKIQSEISYENLQSYVGKTVQVICDGIDYDKQSFYGRAYFNAPDIDGRVYFDYDGDINQGETYSVLIEETDEYDLYGRVQDELT